MQKLSERQLRKRSQKTARSPLQQCVAGAPMDRLGIDIMGPLPQTQTGNRYILVVGDYFSKWMDAWAMTDMETNTIGCHIQTVHHDRLKLFHGNFPNWLEHGKVDLGDDTDAAEYPMFKSDPEITNLIPNGPAKTEISSDSSSSSECEDESVYTRSGRLSRRPAWFSY